MHIETRPDPGLTDPITNVRVMLAALWVCHFILWIFGDMFSLLQGMVEPVTSTAIEFVAPTTAIVLTLMVVFTLVGPHTLVRLATLIAGTVYLAFDIGFLVDATEGWEYYLGAFYLLFAALIIWRAFTWRTRHAA